MAADMMSQQLGSKEQSLFRQVIKFTEEKQYKRGLKSADLILKKFPRHGATMAMKALIWNHQGKKEEAFALAKEALTCDMRSTVSWHVYGLLWRGVKNYEEAIKAYRFALKLDPSSVAIQRDMAMLQIQMRDYAGYIQSRMSMLQARSEYRIHWTSLAVAHHLAGNLAQAEAILTTYEDTLKNPPPLGDVEHSEAVMYKNTVIAEQGHYERALEHLDTACQRNLDRLGVLEARAEYLEKLGRKEDAAAAYRALLERNSEHGEYYKALVRVREIPEDGHEQRKAVYDEWARKFPRCDAARRLPLDFLTGDAFREAAKAYVASRLDRGTPSTFANLKHLYSDEFKKDTLLALVLEYLETSQDSAAADDRSKGRTAALYYLAQHYNYHLSRDLTKAEDYLARAIEIIPKNTDFHMTRARILKHSGDLQKAAEAMDHARTLDTKDRYINSKAAKYQLRNDETAKAVATAGLFTRTETPGGPVGDLHDMQCLWFLTEDAESYERQNNVGMALKRFHAVQAVYETWQEDQFDFHGFAIRKGQVRAYIKMLRWEDTLRQHPTYTRAALGAVALYLEMHDRPASNGVGGRAGLDGKDAAEQKKLAKKARREQERLEREAAEKAAKQDPNKPAQPADPNNPVDDDPLGLKLAATADPLGEAMKFLGPMLQFSPKNIECQIAGFDVLIRRKKFLLALRCLNAALALDPAHPRLHEQAVQLRHTLNAPAAATDAPLPEKAASAIDAEFTGLDSSVDLAKHNAEFREKHKDSPRHVLAAIRASRALGENQASCEKELVDIMGMEGTRDFADGILVLETLRQWRSSQAVVDAAKAKGAERWPLVTRFK